MNLLKGTTEMVTYRNGYKLFMKSKYLVSRYVLNFFKFKSNSPIISPIF